MTLVRAPNPGPMTLDGTNTWVLRAPGARPRVVIDPGPLDEGHLAAVAGARPGRGRDHVTHGHPDHAEGVPPARSSLPGRGRAGTPPADDARRGRAGCGCRAAAPRPGHTARLGLLRRRGVGDERVVLTGDTILGRGTTVVAYPDGDLGDYLDSLRRLERARRAAGPARARAGAGRLRRRGRVLPAAPAGPAGAGAGGGRRRREPRRPRSSRAVYADVDRCCGRRPSCRCGPSWPIWSGNPETRASRIAVRLDPP